MRTRGLAAFGVLVALSGCAALPVQPNSPDAPTPPPASASGSPTSTPPPAASATTPTPNLGSSAYVQPTETLSALPASPVMGPKFAGAKAALVLERLGLARKPGEPYRKQELTDAAVAAIKAFQAERGLPASGSVDKKTWEALVPGVGWEIDHWRAQPALGAGATASARIDQLVAFARAQVGAPYLWGGAGPKEYGYDCSGLMLQALNSAGIDPAPINVVDHQRPDYPTSKLLYGYKGFRHVPVAQAKRGDLVFFGPASNPSSVTHVALVVGDGTLIESVSAGVGQHRMYRSWDGGAYVIRPDAVRVVG